MSGTLKSPCKNVVKTGLTKDTILLMNVGTSLGSDDRMRIIKTFFSEADTAAPTLGALSELVK